MSVAPECKCKKKLTADLLNTMNGSHQSRTILTDCLVELERHMKFQDTMSYLKLKTFQNRLVKRTVRADSKKVILKADRATT